jgi:hypothetical protein
VDKVILVYQYGDFDIPIVIGVATDKEVGKRIIKKQHDEFNFRGKKLVEFPHDEFREEGSKERKYWMETVKLNSRLH